MNPPTREKGKDKRQSKLTFDKEGNVKTKKPQREIHKQCAQVVNGNIVNSNAKYKHSRGTFGLFYKKHSSYANVPKEKKGLNYLIYKLQFGIKQTNQTVTNRGMNSNIKWRINHKVWSARRHKWKKQFLDWRKVNGYTLTEGGLQGKCRTPWMECQWKAPPEPRKGQGKKKVLPRTRHQVQKDNYEKYGSSPLEKTYHDSIVDNIITFEHINVNGLSAKENLVEVKHLLKTMQGINAGVVSVNEHTLDTTQPQLMKKIKDISKQVDPYMKLEMASCNSETAEKFWKPGGGNGRRIWKMGESDLRTGIRSIGALELD